MKKIAMMIMFILCTFAFALDEKGGYAVIENVSVDGSVEAALITIFVADNSELLKDTKIVLEPAKDAQSAGKYNLIIDLMPAVLSGSAFEKQVKGSIVTSVKVSQLSAKPQKTTRVVLTTTAKCDFQKEIFSTKVLVTVIKQTEQVIIGKKVLLKPVSHEDSTKKMGEQVASSQETDKSEQFALRKGSMKKGDLDQIVPYIALTNADLNTFLNTIVSEAGFNLVTSRSVGGNIPSIHLKNVSLKKILDLTLKQNGFAYKVEGNIIRVATPVEMKTEEDSGILETRYFGINFAKASELQGSIAPFLSSSGKIQADSRTNTLIITDLTSKMDMFSNLIISLDTKTAQVNIEAKLVDLKVESEDKLGIRWDFETGGTSGVGSGLMTDIYPGVANTTQLKASISPPTTGSAKAGQFQFGIAGNNSFWIALDALIKTNDANLIANPRITTVDNKMATINISQAYSYVSGFNAQTGVTTYASIDAGVTLEVTPQINRNDYVTLQVKPTVSSIVSPGPPPVVDTRTASTQVLIKDGDTFVIGGLIREDEVVTIHKVPILGDIPLLGALLFQNKTVGKTKRDLVVFMTPHIIR
ncbi:MAG: hypothetical protein NTX32_06050 [Candidatus Firestonebacteria bacterium]|nr:hypothetical protein [Candidatus Firestonebacteria bacterium]